MFRTQRILYRFGMDFSNLSQKITTSGQINYNVDVSGAKPVPGHLVDKKSQKTVIMIHEWWGLNKSICDTAAIFANLGNKFNVFVPDLYRSKPAKDAYQAGHKMSGLDWKGALGDINAIKEHFEKYGKSVYIAGFCMGGALTFASICSIQGWKAASPFYGIPDLNAFKVSNIKCPTLAHFGAYDPLYGFSCSKSAKALEEKCKNEMAPVEVKIWPNAGHAFCNQDSRYFNEKTRNQAFEMTRKFFEKY